MPKLDDNVDLLIKFSSEKIKNIIDGQFNIELCFVSAIFGKSDKIEFLLKNCMFLKVFVSFVIQFDFHLPNKRSPDPTLQNIEIQTTQNI